MVESLDSGFRVEPERFSWTMCPLLLMFSDVVSSWVVSRFPSAPSYDPELLVLLRAHEGVNLNFGRDEAGDFYPSILPRQNCWFPLHFDGIGC